jgi:hypothetical protein
MNKGAPLFICIVCIWPLIVHFLITFGVKFFTRYDWTAIRWSDFKLPWSKDND